MNKQIYMGICASVLLHIGFIAWLIIDIHKNVDNNSGMEAEISDLSQSIMLTFDTPLGKLQEMSVNKKKSSPSVDNKKVDKKISKKKTEVKTKESNIESEIKLAKTEDKKEQEEKKGEEQKENTQDSKSSEMINEEDSKQKDKIASAPKKGEADKAKTQVIGASSKQISSYQGLIMAHLNRFKQYPNEALANKDEGIITLKIKLDEKGRVIEKYIHKTCKSYILNNEALKLIERANPFPVPPKEMLKNSYFTFKIPIKYNIEDYYRSR